ncbi:MAG TPA: NAD(P)-binding domain-containing protein, partial [Candidatus Angelobacter sp.]
MSTAARVSSAANAKELGARIKARTAKVGIVGMGYVGLPLALLFSEREFHVLGFDIDTNKINALNSGKSYIYRIPETEIASAREKNFDATA